MARRVKKDFDKEKMYRKIMPTISAVESAAPPMSLVQQSPAAPEQEQGPVLHNFMEDMVLEKLAHTMKVLGVCDCNRCQKDIVALALNQLPTAYAVVEGDGARYIKKLKGAYEVKVTASLIKAIQQVKVQPRHDGGGEKTQNKPD